MDGVGEALFDQVGFVDQIWGRASNFSCMIHNVCYESFFLCLSASLFVPGRAMELQVRTSLLT